MSEPELDRLRVFRDQVRELWRNAGTSDFSDDAYEFWEQLGNVLRSSGVSEAATETERSDEVSAFAVRVLREIDLVRHAYVPDENQPTERAVGVLTACTVIARNVRTLAPAIPAATEICLCGRPKSEHVGRPLGMKDHWSEAATESED